MPRLTRLAAVGGAVLVAATVFSSPAYASSQDSSQEQPVFVQTGNVNGNAAVAYDAAASGTLTQAGSHSASGLGGQFGGALGGTWGTAEEVPGTATLNQGGDAQTDSVSCASAGNCSAGGYYADSSGADQGFVISETDGSWGTAEEVPGTVTLNQGGDAHVESVSCAGVGNCSAGGYYADPSGSFQAFVVGETKGTWRKAEEVPGTATLNQGGGAGVESVSCASAGNCSVGGFYTDGSSHFQAFVVNETNGSWGTAEQVPGTASLNQGGDAGAESVSCASAGNCSAGGNYTDGSGNGQLFVVSETDGGWGTAEEVPGTASQGGIGDARFESVSCASAGNCSAGGYYAGDGIGHAKAFVVSQIDGSWGTAEEVPGTATLAQGGLAQVFSVSCGAAGNCSAGGNYEGKSGRLKAFVVSETNNSWGTAQEVPGTATLNQGGLATTDSVSCGAPGNCSAVGSYKDGSSEFQAFVVNQTHGTWRKAEEVPGTATLNQGGDAVTNSVSCAAASNCTAGGYFTDSSGHSQAFMVSET